MKNYLFGILLLFLINTSLIASPVDSISTGYKNGEFVTHCQVFVNASDSISNTVIKDFEFQMRYNLEGLFSWALKGMNLRKERNELMIFYFKSTSFNKETNIIRAIGDVIVPGIITIPDIYVDSRLTTRKYANGNSIVSIDLLSANGFMKKMNNSFTVIPRKDKGVWFTLESHVRFGWFFDIFITQKRFKAIMEWRLKRFVHNLKVEAERRTVNEETSKRGNK
jgi:hypothetical protein